MLRSSHQNPRNIRGKFQSQAIRVAFPRSRRRYAGMVRFIAERSGMCSDSIYRACCEELIMDELHLCVIFSLPYHRSESFFPCDNLIQSHRF